MVAQKKIEEAIKVTVTPCNPRKAAGGGMLATRANPQY
jgi:hypothetical protein